MDAPVAEHLESVAREEIDWWFHSQSHDLEEKRRTRTLLEVAISLYVQGLIDGAIAQDINPQDLTPFLEKE